jgi:prepilin-type N-terminal cleavage/methylation domain-containing protein
MMQSLFFSHKGFTLFELLVVISLVTILAFTAFSKFAQISTDNRVLVKSEELVKSLNLAREEAIFLGQKIYFCPNKNQKECGDNWNVGQIIIGEDKKVKQIFPRIYGNDQLIWQGSLHKNYVAFLPNGSCENQGSFYYYPNGKKENACTIYILENGRVRAAPLTM